MRNEIIADWLAQSEWATWQHNPMTGDASSRRYIRLSGASGQSAILMDAPPETCGSQARFVEIADHLRRHSLAAPEVLAWDDTLGLMVLEDLGMIDFARHLSTSTADERALYEYAVDALFAMQSTSPPSGLTKMTPQIGADMVGEVYHWAATDQSANLQVEITTHLHDLLMQVDPKPKVISLRDFHAENLIWRPERQGLSKVGLLDFQDAFVTHPTYDLASLLRDARRDVDPDLLDPLLKRLASDSDDPEVFRTAFHVMAVQRNLRILGIFHRLAQDAGKTSYLSLIPRVWAHLETDLKAPICADLAPLVRRAFAIPEFPR